MEIQKLQSVSELQKLQFNLEITKQSIQETQNAFLQTLEQIPKISAHKLKISQSIKLIFDSKVLKCTKLHKFAKNLIKEKIERIKQRKNLFANQFSKTSVEVGLVRHREANQALENQTKDIGESTEIQFIEKVQINFEKDVQIEKENQKLKKVNKALDKIVSNFQKMGEVVSLHSQMFDDIEMKTVESVELVGKGKRTLQLIYEDVNSHRGFMVKLFSVLTLIAIIYLILRWYFRV